jgi:hypothetical protein
VEYLESKGCKTEEDLKELLIQNMRNRRRPVMVESCGRCGEVLEDREHLIHHCEGNKI